MWLSLFKRFSNLDYSLNRAKRVVALLQLVTCAMGVRLALTVSSYRRVRERLARVAPWLVNLPGAEALIVTRKLRALWGHCLSWGMVSEIYLNHCGERCVLSFAARASADSLSAHAFVKFADGTTLGEKVGWHELR